MSKGLLRVDVECDGCRRVESFIAKERDAAAAAAAAGWLTNPARDQDLCPDCFVERVGSRIPRVALL
jgi:hypothetical protein